MPEAKQVSQADWIEVMPVRNATAPKLALKETGLGAGELSAIPLAKETGADLVPLDESKARRYAAARELPVIGCIGIPGSIFQRSSTAWWEFNLPPL
jgi:predicted nucleic acid-binding protein